MPRPQAIAVSFLMAVLIMAVNWRDTSLLGCLGIGVFVLVLCLLASWVGSRYSRR